MTKDTQKPAQEIQDRDLDQAQGGVIINGDHRTTGDMVSVQIDHNHRVVMGGDNPFNTADGRGTEDSIADATGWPGAAPTPYP